MEAKLVALDAGAVTAARQQHANALTAHLGQFSVKMPRETAMDSGIDPLMMQNASCGLGINNKSLTHQCYQRSLQKEKKGLWEQQIKSITHEL